MGIHKTKIRVGQLNCHNSKTVTAELIRMAEEHNLDFLIAQEYYHTQELREHSIDVNNSAFASVMVFNKNLTFTFLRHLSTRYCAVVEVFSAEYKFFVVSYYFKFCEAIGPHITHLSHVIRSLGSSHIIIGADCNASSPLWHGPSRSSDAERRIAMEEFVAEFNLTVCNDPLAPPTYCSSTGESYIDITLTSGNVPIESWWVHPDASSSDHRLISFEVGRDHQRLDATSAGFSYNTTNGDWQLFTHLFTKLSKDFTRSDLTAEQCAELLNFTIIFCADAALGRRALKQRSKCDWWHERLTNLRCQFRGARRKVNKLKRNNNRDQEYDTALAKLRYQRSKYRAAIALTKGENLRRIASGLANAYPWSPLYHQFKSSSKSPIAYVNNLRTCNGHTTTVEETAEVLLQSLIPDDKPSEYTEDDKRVTNCLLQIPVTQPSSLITVEELRLVCRSLRMKKAPGADRISNKMLKEIARVNPEPLVWILNRCLEAGVFPTVWRHGVLRVIPKGGTKPADDPKSFRPLTLLPSVGKLLERMMVPRLLPGGLTCHPRQFGFTQGRSAIDAALSIRKRSQNSEAKYVLGIFLDISGAFDNAWWPILMLKLKLRGCYSNIYKMLIEYFQNGTVELHLGQATLSKKLTKGCPQGSVLGPYLWNVGFDDFLTIPVPDNCQITAYADDGLLLIESNTRAQVERKAEACLTLVEEWGKRNKLDFAPHKTVQLLLKGKLKGPPRVHFGGTTVANKQQVTYLGMVLQNNFTFTEHVRVVGEKARVNFYAMARISKTTWGIRFPVLRTIYKATYVSSMCYAAPVWVDRSTLVTVKNKMLQSQRMSLIFLCKAYRTVSTDALPVLAGVWPIDLELQRRASNYFRSRCMSWDDFGFGDRQRTDFLFNFETAQETLLSKWQERWECSTKGRHLFQFFPSVRDRLDLDWIEIDHQVSQFLTGHGNFKAKLHGMELVESPNCECSETEQSAHHILWECPLWDEERHTMLSYIQSNSNYRIGAIYYVDLIANLKNFLAFKKFCHCYYWHYYSR